MRITVGHDTEAMANAAADTAARILREACRRQQMGEGWFKRLDDVPRRAISMSVRQIMKSAHIICTVPEQRKARAMKACLEERVGPMVPASILRTHPACEVFLDQESASLLTPATGTHFVRTNQARQQY